MKEYYYLTSDNINTSFAPRAEKRIGQKSFTHIAPRLYSTVLKDMKVILNLKTRRTKLKNWGIEN